MNPNQQSDNQKLAGLLQEWQFPDGIIKPQMLAASTTMAAGDIYYVTTDGIFARLPIGTAGQVLTVSTDGLPSWV